MERAHSSPNIVYCVWSDTGKQISDATQKQVNGLDHDQDFRVNESNLNRTIFLGKGLSG